MISSLHAVHVYKGEIFEPLYCNNMAHVSLQTLQCSKASDDGVHH